MLTFQDLRAVGDDESKRKNFVLSVIQDHERSDDYKVAKDAYEYYCNRNVTISEYQKLLYTVSGNVVPDNWSANYKMGSGHFHRFIMQEVQHLLGNGVSWTHEDTESRLGNRRYSFDAQLQDAAEKALWGKVSFGFFNKDHVDVFDYLEFAPLFDEIDGSLKAGVRYWRLEKNKPLRATLYEIDGYTKYVWYARDDEDAHDEPKRAYLQTITYSEADGAEIYDEENYPAFPIIPFWANKAHQSEIVGLREQIDCFDLIKSGFANVVDEASIMYWTLQNAGGMDDVDLAKFVQKMKTVHAATMDEDGAKAESHTMDAPYQSREALLNRLESDLYRDAMAFDVRNIANGAVTATQIKANYEDLSKKCDMFEYQVLKFVDGILEVAGIDDEASFTRTQIVNQTEQVQTLLQAAQYLPEDYVTTKVLEIMGDADKVEDVLKQMDEERYSMLETPETPEGE